MEQNPKDLLEEINKALGEEMDTESLAEIISVIKSKLNKENQRKLEEIALKIEDSQKTISDTHLELKNALEGIVEALADNKIALPKSFKTEEQNPIKEISVKNLKEIVIPEPKDKVEVKNLKDIPSYKADFLALAKLLGFIHRQLEKEQKVDLDRYTDPKRSLSVRLSDGKRFYEAIATAMSAGSVGTSDYDEIQIVKIGSSGENDFSDRVTNTDGESTAFTNIPADALYHNCITAISVYNSSATAGYVDFRNGVDGDILWTVAAPAGGGSMIALPRPIFKTSKNTALAYDVSGALTTVYISVSGYKSKY